MYVLICAKVPKSKYPQTQGSCHVINTSDKSITIRLVEAGDGNADTCNSGDSTGHFKS